MIKSTLELEHKNIVKRCSDNLSSPSPRIDRDDTLAFLAYLLANHPALNLAKRKCTGYCFPGFGPGVRIPYTVIGGMKDMDILDPGMTNIADNSARNELLEPRGALLVCIVNALWSPSAKDAIECNENNAGRRESLTEPGWVRRITASPGWLVLAAPLSGTSAPPLFLSAPVGGRAKTSSNQLMGYKVEDTMEYKGNL
nr:hypothetical protein Iba_chr07bCG3240 [Ipomoea batatas]